MQLKLFVAQWGYTHLPQVEFLDKMRLAGYDGFDMWLPTDAALRKELFDYLQKHQMLIIPHQHQAAGATFDEFKASYLRNLHNCAEAGPLFINSHTGRDYFSFDQNLALFDVAFDFTAKTGITVVHETHRRRSLYNPMDTNAFFKLRSELLITADFSHWTCVTGSMLENFSAIMDDAMQRTRHIHARVGYTEGPQIPDPRAPEWDDTVQCFLGWWDKIAALHRERNSKYLTFTTEFGPEPYMPTIPFTNQPVADLFEVNCYMKDLLRNRYAG